MRVISAMSSGIRHRPAANFATHPSNPPRVRITRGRDGTSLTPRNVCSLPRETKAVWSGPAWNTDPFEPEFRVAGQQDKGFIRIMVHMARRPHPGKETESVIDIAPPASAVARVVR